MTWPSDRAEIFFAAVILSESLGEESKDVRLFLEFEIHKN